MDEYSDNLIWRLTLEPKNDKDENYRKSLRTSFDSTRKNVIEVLEEIRKDFPNLTLHDISHSDSLWNIASIIVGKEDYPLNPLEGYILGCSFLFHDAALSYAAFDGVDNLRDTDTWRDCFAELTNNEVCYNSEEIKKKADFWAIRLLHADGAKNLLTKLYTRPDKSTFYLIEDYNLRIHLSSIIGDIIASHHWSYEELNTLPNQFNSLAGLPNSWTIIPKKLACILRCSDAAHIDNGRAPDHLFHLMKLNGVSYNHWSAQNRLTQIAIDTSDKSKLIINSTFDFKEDEFAIWNVAYEAVTVLNNELKYSNKLLKSINNNLCFQSTEVTGADSREEMSRYVKTNGWEPCESNIKISNVADLITNLGGSNLYGSDNHILIVLRELIQNARDAIKAKENYEKSFENGEILIEVEEISGEYWISIFDNGIGMSSRTIKTSFLDFGTSFWASELSKKEFPGLRSSSFKSIGEFGIGFYSVFMVASYVSVESRRFDDSLDRSTVIKFPSGITLNPIISTKRGTSTYYNTIVKLKIDENKYKWTENYSIKRNAVGLVDFDVPFYGVLQVMCAGLDVDLYYKSLNTGKRLIHHNVKSNDLDKKQWLKDISFAEFRGDEVLLNYIDENYKRLKYISSNGKIHGLAAIRTLVNTDSYFLGISTIGGLSSSINGNSKTNFIGFMDHKPNSAKREIGKVVDCDSVKNWALDQYEDLIKDSPDLLNIHYLQYNLCEFNVDPINICNIFIVGSDRNASIIFLDDLLNGYLNKGKSLIMLLFSLNPNYIETHFEINEVYKKMKSNDIFFIPQFNGSFLNVELINNIPVNNYSFIDCLHRKSQLMNIKLKYSIIQNYAPSKISGICSALVIETIKD